VIFVVKLSPFKASSRCERMEFLDATRRAAEIEASKPNSLSRNPVDTWR